MPSIRVLMGDPDERLLTRYRKLLGQEFELVTARTGLECLARLREGIPNVFVLEPRLPWGGGDGVLAMMHDDPQIASVPVMILTGSRDRALLESVPHRISDYYVKPLPAVRLAKRIRTVLDHRRSARPEATPLPEFRIESRVEPVAI